MRLRARVAELERMVADVKARCDPMRGGFGNWGAVNWVINDLRHRLTGHQRNVIDGLTRLGRRIVALEDAAKPKCPACGAPVDSEHVDLRTRSDAAPARGPGGLPIVSTDIPMPAVKPPKKSGGG